MRLYNTLIRSVEEQLSASAPRVFPYDPAACWEETADFEMVMMRDSAFELGGDGKPTANFTCVTTDPALVSRDEILVYGKDLSELKASAPSARIALVRVGDIESDDEADTETAFNAIRNIDFVKYHVFPRGFMMRTSAESHREQVRVSKDAVRDGISFRSVGSAFISRYKKDINVLAVKLIFITDPTIDFKQLLSDAKAARDITMTLSKIMEGLPTDCGTCALKPVCDEVEGMKELHFGKGSHTTQ